MMGVFVSMGCSVVVRVTMGYISVFVFMIVGVRVIV